MVAISDEARIANADPVGVELIGSTFSGAYSKLENNPLRTEDALALVGIAIQLHALLTEDAAVAGAFAPTTSEEPVFDSELIVLDPI